jgi:hypothetical protein
MYAHGVGDLCQRWSRLEVAVRKLLRSAARMPSDEPSDLVLRCFDFRDQLAAIKVGVASMPTLSEMVVDEIIEVVDYVDNTLRPRRNRFVHDQWIDQRGLSEAFRVQVKPKVVRPQSRKRRTVVLESAQESWQEVQQTSWVIGNQTRYITKLAKLLDAPTGKAFRALLSQRPERPPFLRQQETPRPKGRSSPKRPPPPES